MTLLRTLRKLVLGETWLLPLGVAAVVLGAAVLARPLLGAAWEPAGGFVVLVGACGVLAASVGRGARGR